MDKAAVVKLDDDGLFRVSGFMTATAVADLELNRNFAADST